MSVDEAFDNLMNRNALSIPVARQAGGTDVRDAGSLNRSAPGPVPAHDSGQALPGGAMRVSSLIGEEPVDYNPEYDGDTRSGVTRKVYERPTVTDLEPVSEDEVDNARNHGARVLGRDAPADAAEYSDDFDGDDLREVDAYDHDDSGGDSGLGLARRVRRFAYLPLSGMDDFENCARELAAGLISLHPDSPSLAITSARRGEGRTELAMRLALALAKRVGYRVLLADFDIRHPQAGARLGVSSKFFTLSDVLRGSCPLGEALVVSEEDNLYVLPSRASDRDGDEVLDNRQVVGLMGQLHATFDFVVIDCGPVGQADTTILCRLAGATALAGFCGSTRVKEVHAAAKTLEEASARVSGVLLTGA